MSNMKLAGQTLRLCKKVVKSAKILPSDPLVVGAALGAAADTAALTGAAAFTGVATFPLFCATACWKQD